MNNNLFTVIINRPGWRLLHFVLPFLIFFSVLLIDVLFLKIHPLREGLPIFSPIYLLRSLLVIASSGFTMISILKLNKAIEDTNLTVNNKTYLQPLLLIVMVTSIACLWLFLTNASAFSSLCREDHLIENVSALLFILCSIGFGYVAFKIHKIDNSRNNIAICISILLAITFFFIAMEEISWCQRIWKIETSELFRKNFQHELNLHNFATREVEILYYFFSFIFFIVLPNITLTLIFKKNTKKIALLIPGLSSFYSASIFVAYNYDMWNIAFIQFAYFLTLFYLIYYFFAEIKSGGNILVTALIILIFIASQIIILITGSKQIRIWDFTEYKELFIALSFSIYTVEVFYRLRKTTRIIAVTN